MGVLSARTLAELKLAISPEVAFWTNIFDDLDKGDFDHLSKFKNLSHTSTYSYIELRMALELIPNFSIASSAYGSIESQEKKFKQLLNALTFLDCDTFLTLILKRFRWSLVEELLGKNIPTEIEEPLIAEETKPKIRVKKNVKIIEPDQQT